MYINHERASTFYLFFTVKLVHLYIAEHNKEIHLVQIWRISSRDDQGGGQISGLTVSAYADLDRKRNEDYDFSASSIFLCVQSQCVCHQSNDLFRFLKWHSLVNFSAFSACFPYGRDELGSLMTIENERQGNSVWLCRQWAIGALQSSINSMCTAICSQCLCPNTAALTQTALYCNVSHVKVAAFSPEISQTKNVMFDKVACHTRSFFPHV